MGWREIASDEIRSRIYLLSLDVEKKISDLEDYLDNWCSSPTFYGRADNMIGRGSLQDRWIEGGYHMVKADLSVYRDFLRKWTDAGSADIQAVEKIIRKVSPLLNRLGASDIDGLNAILDMQLCAASPEYFFRKASLDKTKDKFEEELRIGIKGFENEVQAYLSHLFMKLSKPAVNKALDRLEHFPDPPPDLKISQRELDETFQDAFPFFLQGIIAIVLQSF